MPGTNLGSRMEEKSQFSTSPRCGRSAPLRHRRASRAETPADITQRAALDEDRWRRSPHVNRLRCRDASVRRRRGVERAATRGIARHVPGRETRRARAAEFTRIFWRQALTLAAIIRPTDEMCLRCPGGPTAWHARSKTSFPPICSAPTVDDLRLITIKSPSRGWGDGSPSTRDWGVHGAPNKTVCGIAPLAVMAYHRLGPAIAEA